MKLIKATKVFKDFFMHHFKPSRTLENMLEFQLSTIIMKIGNKKLSSIKLNDWEEIEPFINRTVWSVFPLAKDRCLAWAIVYLFFIFSKKKGYKINDDVFNAISQKYETHKAIFEHSKEFKEYKEILMKIE